MKKTMSVVLLLVIAISCCTFSDTGVNAVKRTKKISVSKKVVSVRVGKKVTVKLKNVNKKVTWRVKNKKIAKIVNKKGKYKNVISIKGMKRGNTKIVAKYKNKKYTVKIKVVTKKNKSGTKNKDIKDDIEETTTVENETKTEVKEGIQLKILNSPVRECECNKLNIQITNYTNKALMTTYQFGKLEKEENGEWINAASGSGGNIEIISWLYYDTPMVFTIDFGKSGSTTWIDLKERLTKGHYRYLHLVENQWVSGEFEIVE